MLGQTGALGVMRGQRRSPRAAFGRASVEGCLEEVRLNESQLVGRSFLRVLGRPFQVESIMCTVTGA